MSGRATGAWVVAAVGLALIFAVAHRRRAAAAAARERAVIEAAAARIAEHGLPEEPPAEALLSPPAGGAAVAAPAVPPPPENTSTQWTTDAALEQTVRAVCPNAPHCVPGEKREYMLAFSCYGPSNQIWAFAELALAARMQCRRVVLPWLVPHYTAEATGALPFTSVFDVAALAAWLPIAPVPPPECTAATVSVYQYTDWWLTPPELPPAVGAQARLLGLAGVNQVTIQKEELKGVFFPRCTGGNRYSATPQTFAQRTAGAQCAGLAAPLSQIADPLGSEPLPDVCDWPRGRGQKNACCRSRGLHCTGGQYAKNPKLRKLAAKWGKQPDIHRMLDRVVAHLVLTARLQKVVDDILRGGPIAAVHARRMEIKSLARGRQPAGADEICIGMWSNQIHCLHADCIADHLAASGAGAGHRLLLCTAPFGREFTIGSNFSARMAARGFPPASPQPPSAAGLSGMEQSLVEQYAAMAATAFIGTHDSSWSSFVGARRRAAGRSNSWLSRLPCARLVASGG